MMDTCSPRIAHPPRHVYARDVPRSLRSAGPRCVFSTTKTPFCSVLQKKDLERDELTKGYPTESLAVLCTFRESSLCRHMHRELMRNVVLDLTPIIAATTCNQRNYVERYSRSMTRSPNAGSSSCSSPRVSR